MSRVLILEMNELTPRLLRKFMSEGYLPNFEKLYQQSYIYQTDAGESGLNLNPWVQWFTVHSGVPFDEHQVYLLGEGYSKEIPTLGNVVSSAGSTVALFGSMNVGFDKPLNGVAMPDAWADGVTAYPDTLEPFRKFVQSQVQEHTNPDFRPTLKDYVEFGTFMIKHGLSASTTLGIMWQLASERFNGRTWKRPFVLDSLQWDAFSHFYDKNKPDFATFFSNSVAHTQHTHWREFEPEPFEVKPSQEELEKYGDAIRDAYVANDKIVKRALSIIDSDTTLIFCTALSQRPALEWESEGGKTFYRPYDIEEFCRFLGIEADVSCRPVMAEEFWIEFNDDKDLEQGLEVLEGAMLGGERLMKTYPREGGIYTGCRLHMPLADDAEIVTHDGRRAAIKGHLYQSQDVKSGKHDRSGLLWISLPNREHKSFDENPVALETIAPTVLQLLGIAPSPSMRAEPLREVVH